MNIDKYLITEADSDSYRVGTKVEFSYKGYEYTGMIKKILPRKGDMRPCLVDITGGDRAQFKREIGEPWRGVKIEDMEEDIFSAY